VGGALQRQVPGVIINDVAGNPYQPEIDFRGFVASPISGTPQGLAVYQNGIRVNEAWGDSVNWDLIPNVAIDRLTVVTGNPLFGLNALGGAVTLDMKNGFTYQGFEFDGRVGSFARRREQCNTACSPAPSPAILPWKAQVTTAIAISRARTSSVCMAMSAIAATAAKSMPILRSRRIASAPRARLRSN
ncbi:MAG TPA: Plug domain-containing protein, partial [Methylocystis sp.]|jgi:hypothetical protein